MTDNEIKERVGALTKKLLKCAGEHEDNPAVITAAFVILARASDESLAEVAAQRQRRN